MPAYISEIHYDGNKNVDFFEIAVAESTDVSGYSIELYDGTGDNYNSFSLGTPVTTIAGQDVYLIDNSTEFFSDSRAGHGIALTDDLGTVIQFVSYDTTPTTITATNGPAAGLTSTYIGNASSGSSLETTDDGATYAVQLTVNPGTIPCFAPGTQIATPQGARSVETLAAGDFVLTLDHGAKVIKWVNHQTLALEPARLDQRPVLIAAGALGRNLPATDMIVSPQHRILVGGHGQLEKLFPREAFVPAKALTSLPKIRFMRGKREITWVHFAFNRHEIVIANGCFSESLYFGETVLRGLPPQAKLSLARYGFSTRAAGNSNTYPTARHCLTVAQARSQIEMRRQDRSRRGSSRDPARFAIRSS